MPFSAAGRQYPVSEAAVAVPCILINRPMPDKRWGIELRFRTNQNINGGLTCNLRYEVRPAL
jgi:hypothetical protein